MTGSLRHPLWTHAPAAVLLLGIAFSFWSAWPLPDPAPVHFGRDGAPDRMGASWEMPLVVAVASLLALGLSVAIDEAWARQETRRRFNLFAVGDELFLAILAAVTLDYTRTLALGEPYVLHLSWAATTGIVAVAMAFAVALEALRPFRPSGQVLTSGPDAQLEEELTMRRVQGHPWVYWESQNPRYARLLLPVMGAGMLALGVMTWNDNRWAAAAALGAGLLVLLACAGGFRVSVNEKRVQLRAGLLGIRLLDLPIGDIASAEVHRFSPLADFGGYGIRRRRETTAYFLEGDTGVELTTTEGKKYLIGSRQPERLAAVILAARELPRAGRQPRGDQRLT